MRNTHVPVGPWRGVNTNQNAVYMECFMDEVAKAAGKDPLEFRRALMKDFPKHLAVLDAAAEKGDWGKPLPAGCIAASPSSWGTAAILPPSPKSRSPRRARSGFTAWCQALNCGHDVNTSQIEAKLQGSVAFGLTATLYGEMPVKDGRMTSRNFDSYEIMRLAEDAEGGNGYCPDLRLLGRRREPTICAVAPAVLNAVFAATSKPMRNLPLKNVKLV